MAEPIDFVSRVSEKKERHRQVEATKVDVYQRAFESAVERYQGLKRLNADPFNIRHLNSLFESLYRKFSASPSFNKEDLTLAIAEAIHEVFQDALENSFVNAHITESAYRQSLTILDDFINHLPNPVSPHHGR